LPGELGDLLFQVVFYSQMASEAGLFAMPDVLKAINDKMIARHPHVFGDATVASAEAQTQAWEAHKAQERADDAARSGRRPSVLDGVAAGLPALTRAEKLQRRAARIGFDWPEAEPVIDKVHEELEELRVELQGDRDHERLAEELGDLLFACANLARHLGVDPEGALRRGNRKFERRFMRMEELAAEQAGTRSDAGSAPGPGSGGGQVEVPPSLECLEALWERVKAEEALPHSGLSRSASRPSGNPAGLARE
jgi:MazG family protein